MTSPTWPRGRRAAVAVAAGVVATLVAGCTGGAPAVDEAPADAAVVSAKPDVVDDALGLPQLTGKASVAPAPPAESQPTKRPAQAGPDLSGRALPTSQWWSSALTGPLTQPLWPGPLAVQATDAGVAVSGAAPEASANAVVTPFVTAMTAGGAVQAVQVTGYGPMHVSLSLALREGGAIDTTVTQGSPVLQLRFRDTAPVLTLGAGAAVGAAPGGAEDALRVTVANQRWDVVDVAGGGWRRDGATLRSAAEDGLVALARVPDGVDDAAWSSALAAVAPRPVTSTAASVRYDATSGVVLQTLTVQRAGSAAGVWALLPHHQAGLQERGVQRIAGRYPSARGALSVVTASTVQVSTPMPGLLPAVPTVALPSNARAAVLADLRADLADKPGAGGSYFGLKELGRLASIAESADALGAEEERRAALDRLRPQLVDWLTYSGATDGRYFAYDETWGGLIAVPAEFGSNDYNDHHFQYGYLVRAAAVLGAAEPAFVDDYGPLVDLVVRDFVGGAGDKAVRGLPAFRVFNAFLGHSAAAGYAPFADGNNQESSSEAVHAWEAVARWGLVRQRGDLVEAGVTRYALEAATARTYWLGETAGVRPEGYAHTVAGIVWDAKVDFATWFDARPEAVFGIQLLPLTFGSLYRYDADAARTRAAELRTAVGGKPRLWGDLFAADLAVTDPKAARTALAGGVPREPSTSRALVRYWVEALAVLGPPQPAVRPDGPLGLAFGRAEAPTLVAVNPTGEAMTVTFRRGGERLGSVEAGPGATVVRGRAAG